MEVEEQKISLLARQLFISSGPIILTIACGAVAAYSGILLPQLQQESSTIKITENEYSWIASIAALQMSLGCILGGYIMQKFGRKVSQISGSIPGIAGWILIYFATNVGLLLTGRFFSGLSAGMLAPPTNVYIAEVALPKYRGFLLTALVLALAFGMFLAHLLGTFFTWQTTALLNTAFPIIGFLLLLFTPESPSWLTKKGKFKQAEENFLWCRGVSSQAKEEVAAMLQKQQQQQQGKVNNFKEMLRKRFLKPMGIIVVFLAATQLTGVNAITFYSVSITQSAVGDDFNEYTAMLIVDGLRVVACLVACILLRRTGRRRLALISGIGCTISLLLFSLFTFLQKIHTTFHHYSIFSLLSLISYMCFVMLGLMPLPWTMLGELLPLNGREYGSGVASSVAFLAMFIVVKCNPLLFETLGVSATFLIYGCVALGETIFLFVVLPETKNKTLQEVEDLFISKKSVELPLKKANLV